MRLPIRRDLPNPRRRDLRPMNRATAHRPISVARAIAGHPSLPVKPVSCSGGPTRPGTGGRTPKESSSVVNVWSAIYQPPMEDVPPGDVWRGDMNVTGRGSAYG